MACPALSAHNHTQANPKPGPKTFRAGFRRAWAQLSKTLSAIIIIISDKSDKRGYDIGQLTLLFGVRCPVLCVINTCKRPGAELRAD
jgi:hypothetical protein